MTLLILLGLLNGVAVSLSRTLNGRLASARGAMTASLACGPCGQAHQSALMLRSAISFFQRANSAAW